MNAARLVVFTLSGLISLAVLGAALFALFSLVSPPKPPPPTGLPKNPPITPQEIAERNQTSKPLNP